MNLYKLLKEDSVLNQIRDRMLPKIHNIQNDISKYVLDTDTYKEQIYILNNLIETLDDLNLDFKNIGYDYEPEMIPDVSENTFKSILDNFKEELARFLNNFNEDLFESTSTQIRYIMNLIEIHRTNIINNSKGDF